jgi:transposase InsO family protein
VLRRPIESAQYLSYDYTQTLDDHGVLASCGSVGDAYDNALAESFVDTFKTELIADRVWRTQAQLEHAIVGYIGWYTSAGTRTPYVWYLDPSPGSTGGGVTWS